MRQRTFALVRLVCGLGLVCGASPALAQLCGPTADPCIVAANLNVPSGSVFNLGTRDLIIAANKTLTVQGAGILSVTAGDITLDDGARIVASGNTGVGGDINLTAAGAIVLDPSSRIDVSSGSAGAIDLVAATVQMSGQLRANATLRDGEGGFVSIRTTGAVNIAGTGILGSSGDRFGCGGFIEVVSDGSVTASAPIEFKGGDCDGGDVDVDALGNITITATSRLNTIATYEFGSGGAASLTAGGNVTLNGTVIATGSGTLLEGGGDGGDLDIIADNVTIGGQVNLTGAGPDGSGGFVDVTALGLLRVSAPLVAMGAQEGVGGDVLLAADGNIEVNSTVDLRAGFTGGSFDAFAIGNFSTVSATVINASGTGSPIGLYGGTVDVQACNLTIPIGADVLATGAGPTPRATTRLAASGTLTLGGTVAAGARVELRYRSIPPVFVPGFVISPAPIVAIDGALPCCVGCGVTTTSTSSSTSSTIGGITTTVTLSSSSTSSSSSTTLPGPCGAPMNGCRVPTQAFKAKLLVRDKSKDSADKIVWKWLRGQATAAAAFGNPLASDGYSLCLWSVAGSPTLIARADAPAGGTCNGNACWRTTGRNLLKGYKYIDSDLTPNGTQKVILAAGTAGKAKVVVKAKGEGLTLPPLPLALPVLVQLQGAGTCFETYFTASGVARNTTAVFEGRGSSVTPTTTPVTSTTSTTSPVPICGNGAQEFPEQCDDGNLESDDCCSASCTAESAGGACAEDGNVCTYDLCDGRGACAHRAGNAGLTCRPPLSPCDTPEQCSGVSTDCPADVLVPDGTECDATACLTGETCAAGVCGGGSPVACAVCESCDAVAGCVATPVEVCRQTILPGRSTLVIKDRSPDTGDQIVWKWAKGEETTPADFGTPNLDDDYAVCLYDETMLSTALVTRITAPAAGVCGGAGCWRATWSGFKYVDPDLTPDGIRKLLLKSGASGTSAITFKAKGDNIPMPILPLGSAVRLQVLANGECWEATFAPGSVSQNDWLGFKARSD